MKPTAHICMAWLFLASLTVALPPAARADAIRSYNRSSTIQNSHPKWMSWVPDSTLLSDLSLPGTHDTMSLYGGDLVETQSLPLRSQLDAGIRVLDIRCRHIEDVFAIHHGVVFQNAYFGNDVLKVCYDFLQENPTETIIMNLGNAGVPDEKDCTRTYAETFSWYRDTTGYGSVLATTSDIDYTTMQTLGAVRGKVVVIQSFSGGRHGYDDDEYSNLMDKQSEWDLDTLFDLDEKWDTIKAFFQYTDGDVSTFTEWDGVVHSRPAETGRFYVNSISASSSAGGVYPNAVALYVNPRVHKYLFSGSQKSKTGIVWMDFPGAGIIDAIIAQNFNLTTDSNRSKIRDSFQTIFNDICYVFEDGDYDDFSVQERAESLAGWVRRVLFWRGPNYSIRDHWSVIVSGKAGSDNWGYALSSGGLLKQSDWIDGYSSVAVNAVSRATNVTSAELQSYLTGGALSPFLKPELATAMSAAGNCVQRASALKSLVSARLPGAFWNVAVSKNHQLGIDLDITANGTAAQISGSDVYAYRVWAGAFRDSNIPPVPNAGGPYVIGEGSTGYYLTVDSSLSNDPDKSGVPTYYWDFDNDGVWDVGTSSTSMTVQGRFAALFSKRGTYTVNMGMWDGVGSWEEKTVRTTATVTVTNIPPKLNLGTATEDVVAGASLFRQGSFADRGQNPWTVTVNYGDGTPVQSVSYNEFKTFQLNHTYSTAGNRTVTVTVNDGVATAQATFLVRVLPAGERWLSLKGTANAVGEGSPVTLNADFFYPGFGGPPNNEEVRIVWGDGTPDEYPVVNGAGGNNTFSVPHVYQKNLADPNASYVATVYFGNWTQRTFAFTVTNVPPQLASITYPATVREAQPFYLSYTIADPGKELRMLRVDWGDGTQSQQPTSARSGSFDQPHRYANVGTYIITVRVTDDDGATAVETRNITVIDDVPSNLVIHNPNNAYVEGEEAQLEGQFQSYNYANDDVIVWIYWGDGTRTARVTDIWQEGDESGTTHFRATHTYQDNSGVAPFTVIVRIDDDADVNRQTAYATNAVSNLPPVVDPVANFAIAEGLSLTLSGHITDPGPADTFTGTVNYGDGTGVKPLSIVGSYYQLNHTYAAGGVYTVTVNVTDDDGAGSGSRTMQVFAGPVRSLLVTNTNDSGPGSLRQAVLEANTPSANSTAFPNAYADIRFAPALSGQTITLTSGQLVSSLRTRIDASSLAAGINVSGNNASRILEIALNNSVIIDSLHLTAGSTSQGGGAILVNSEARLSLNSCSISNCITTDRGGGIFFVKGAALTVNQCAISGCGARDGGGVYFYGLGGKEFRANNSTFSGNSATGASASAGGAIFNGSGRVVMHHSTVASNAAAGATSNGGGIHNSTGATLELHNSIVAGNSGAGSANISGTSSGTRNLISGDPMLFPLGNYGGPTVTMPPRLDSPAIDAVTSVSIPAYTVPSAHWRLGEDDPAAANTVSTTATSNRYGGALTFNHPVTYSSAVSPIAAGWLDSRLGLQFSAGTGTYGTNRLVADVLGGTVFTDNFGIELWVKPDDLNGYKCLAYNGDTSANGWGLYQFGGSYGALFGGVTFIGFGSAPVTPGTWAHLALVRDRGITTFYVNGVSTAGTAAAPNVPTGRFAVGAPPQWLNREFFNGALDEVRVFTFQPGQFSPDGLSYQPRTPRGFSYAPGSEGTLASGNNWKNDQRGYPRVSGRAADIGAVEVEQRVVRVTDNDGSASLRRTLAELSSPGIATFAPALSSQVIALTSGQLLLNKHVRIDASALPGGVAINGNRASRIFEVPGGNNVSLNSLTLSNGAAGGDIGGAIVTAGTLSMANCSLIGNSSAQGGAMQLLGGDCSMLNCTISGNTVTGNGGAFDNSFNPGTLALVHCTVFGNSSGGGIGGIANFLRTLALTNTIVAGNNGADIYNFSGSTVHLGGANIVPSFGNAGISSGPGPVTAAPLLAPPGQYGGPTLTMPPLPGSPAIDAAAGTGFVTDQRRAVRPTGPAPDIGSVEAFPFSTLPLVDGDGDGADDRMELGYFGNLTTITSSGDTDNDGSPDTAELGNMTDPRNPADRLRITAFTPAPGFDPETNPLFDVTVSTFPGLSYALQSSRTLTDFKDIAGTSFTAVNRTQTLRVAIAPARDFLRARR